MAVFVDLRCAECAHCLNCSSFDDSLACACETGYTGARCHLGELKDGGTFAIITLAPGEECEGNAFGFVCLSVYLPACVTQKLLVRLT